MNKLILHEKTKYMVDPVNGVVYGIRGKPIVGKPRASRGYATITIRKGRGVKHLFLHRIIWEAVNGPIDPLRDDRFINHKNGIKTDNRIENLELVTHRENIRHAYAIGLFKCKKGMPFTKNNKPRPVIGTCLKTGVQKTYTSIRSVAKDGFSPPHVLGCCRGIHKTARGFSWEFVSGL